MRYCKICTMPDTRPGIVFDEDGVCCACRHYENRKNVDWDKRWEELEKLCGKYRGCNGEGYQSVKTLEPDYAEKLKLMRRFCNLYSYARLIRCVAEEYPDEPDWMGGLREKLHRKIVFLENSVTGM